MKLTERFLKLAALALFILAMMISRTAWAVPLSVGGTPIIAIDGDGDSNVTIDVLASAPVSPYTYGYFLNGSTTFTALGPFSITTFQGGDIIDFALYDGTKYYSLSGDLADDSYSVEMGFTNQVTTGLPEKPIGWPDPYYYNVNITWTLPTAVNSNEWVINMPGGNDGIAPIPEPATLVLLGSGLAGIGLWKRKRSNMADK